MSLSVLPNEILTEILMTISCEISLTKFFDLASMSICSHRLHNLVEPFLYSSFRETHHSTLLSFLRTILETPRLALLVKSYEGKDARTYTYEKPLTIDTKDSCQQQDLEEMLLSAIQQGEINADGAFIWCEDILDGCWDAATALSMLSLPNLQTFQVSVMSDSRMASRTHDIPLEDGLYDDVFDAMSYRWINRAFRDAQELQTSQDTISKQSMSKLDTIRLVLSDSHLGDVWTSNLLGFLGLKSLKTFEGVYMWPRQVDRSEFSVANLRFNNCPDHLGSGIYCPPTLTQFRNVKSFQYSADSRHPFVFTLLVSSLFHMAPSLRELVVRGSRNDNPKHSCNDNASPTSFVVLEKLDITAPSLIRWLNIGPTCSLPWDITLPRTLKTLIIRECVLSIVIEAGTLIDRKQPGFHKLEILHLGFRHDFPRDSAQKEVGILKKQCMVVGVKFTVDWNGRELE